MDQASVRRNAQCIKTAQKGTSKESQHLRIYCAQRLVRGKEDSERNSDDLATVRPVIAMMLAATKKKLKSP